MPKRTREPRKSAPKPGGELHDGARVRVIGGPYDNWTGWFRGKLGTTGYVRVMVQPPDGRKAFVALVTKVEPISD
jgi:hypothetical protein